MVNVDKKYNLRTLRRRRVLYPFFEEQKWSPMGTNLSIGHIRPLFCLNDSNEFKCYVVVELKVTELKKEHIGQVMIYMNYIDQNLKTMEENKTVGIIICRKNNKYVIEYCSDKRIIAREYELIW